MEDERPVGREHFFEENVFVRFGAKCHQLQPVMRHLELLFAICLPMLQSWVPGFVQVSSSDGELSDDEFYNPI